MVVGVAIRDKGRLKSQNSGIGAHWFSGGPNPACGVEVEPQTYRLLLKWWLGVPLLPPTCAGVECPLCKAPCDTLGDHFVSCPLNHALARHTLVQDALLRVCEAARIPCLREQGVTPEGNERPADILLLHWQQGRDAAVDIMVSHPAQPSEYPLKVERMSAHLKKCEEGKLRKNQSLCDRLGWACLPFGVDSWGNLGPAARGTFQQLVKRATVALEGWAKAQRCAEIQQNVARAIMMGVGRQLGVVHHVQRADMEE